MTGDDSKYVFSFRHGTGRSEAEGLEINIASYDYDRVHAIMERQVGIGGADNISEPFSLHIRACCTKKQ